MKIKIHVRLIVILIQSASATVTVAQPTPASEPALVSQSYCNVESHKTERCCKLSLEARAHDHMCRLNPKLFGMEFKAIGPDLKVASSVFITLSPKIIAPGAEPQVFPSLSPGSLGGISR